MKLIGIIHHVNIFRAAKGDVHRLPICGSLQCTGLSVDGRSDCWDGGGCVRQTGTVPDVFSRPCSLDVARIVETETILSGKVFSVSDGLATVDVAGVRLLQLAERIFEQLAETLRDPNP